MKKKVKNYCDAKSVHIFSWPFIFKDVKSNEKHIKKVERQLRSSERWYKESFNDETNWIQHKERFMLQQYLSKKARKIFFDSEDSKCCIYQYKMRDEEEYEYIIEVEQEDRTRKLYSLPIDKIELHLYDFGMGILSIRVLNFRYTSIQDIKYINNFGRRTFLPFLPESENGFILCAEQLGIREKFNGIENIKKFRDEIKNSYNQRDAKETGKLYQPVNFLKGLLDGNLRKQEYEKWNYIKATEDDRMFLTCLIKDNELSKEIKERNSEKADVEELIYSIIYVDNRDCECQDKTMRRELLNKAEYPRWADYGTMYACTNYSLVCITGEMGVNATVVRPFIEEYFYMISLTLAQKQALMIFSDRAGNMAKNVGNGKKSVRKRSENIIKLQEEYVRFQNHYMVLEVSSQEQGIELYQLFQKQLMVYEEKEVLDQEMGGLYEIANVGESIELSKTANKLAKWGLGLAVIVALVAPFWEKEIDIIYGVFKCFVCFILDKIVFVL